MISPVSRKVDLKKSIKKYFLDSLETIESVPLFFESLSETPLDDLGEKLSQWVIISFRQGNLGNVSEQMISIGIYTRNDSEGDDLAALNDLVMGYLLDEESTNGLVTIPFYDTSADVWVVVGGIIPFLQLSLGEMEGEDGTKFKEINVLCKWGGK